MQFHSADVIIKKKQNMFLKTLDYFLKHLPEMGSDHACSLPPYSPPCTEEHGRSFPDDSERKRNRLTSVEEITVNIMVIIV